MRSSRLIATPGRFSGFVLPLRFSFHRLSPISHKARACSAVVLPELFGPMKTTGFPQFNLNFAKVFEITANQFC